MKNMRKRKAKKETECPKSAKISRVVNVIRPAATALLKHAKNCTDCFFWLSFMMAINKAYFSITRILDTNCPAGKNFRYLLVSLARDIKIRKDSYVTEAMRRFKEAEREQTGWILEHMRGCGFCDRYYDELRGHMFACQKEYGVMIKRGAEIKPIVINENREIFFSRINRVDYFMAVEAFAGNVPVLEAWEKWLPKDREKQKPN